MNVYLQLSKLEKTHHRANGLTGVGKTIARRAQEGISTKGNSSKRINVNIFCKAPPLPKYRY